MIDTIKNRKNLYLQLTKWDIAGKVKKILDRGYIVRPEDGMIVPRQMAIAHDAPWVYTKSDPLCRCELYHKVFYNILDHIHSRCRGCWKVVVRPRTLVELFDLYELQKEMDVFCKCGIELRKTVNGNYGGYFYCKSKEEGLRRYEEVKNLIITDNIGPDIPIILKRYCTEFEIGGEGIKGHGPSNQTPYCTPEELEMEAYIEAHFPNMHPGTISPKHQIATTLRSWIHHAYSIGDQTYLEFTNGERLFPTTVTYHDEVVPSKEG
jgi:hypothetical protein